ncbi:ABC transporter ATP-binding protein [Gracilibacillus thailandensis]|uniref:ATP-binding cassette domain-containing protein n=1 Tax=Gracilibacillus thailandensis TaxID=563735 RepID=A0A6N7QVM5_9BACI|nr:ABC transporter ATP-binding protein [Gracilibacillus thailandensis]MRI65202.1 ATP-binding cassette domain-containing protein [Gracilibacillus thailandensis]
MKPSTEKRLFQYALTSKKYILIGLVCLIIAVGLELTGPFIAKRVIDNHIVGIQTNWTQVEEQHDTDTIRFNGMFLKRADRLTDQDQLVSQHTLLQSGKNFYLVNQEVPPNSSVQSANDDRITISYNNTTEQINGIKLNVSDLYTFFQPEISPIVLLLGLYLGLILIASIFQYFKTYLLQVSANKIIQRMRNDVFQRVEELPMNYFVKRPAGKIVARVTNDTEAIKELYVKVLETFVNGFVYMTGIFVALFLLNASLATICLIVIPILFVWMKLFKKYASKYNRVIRSTNSEINASINESIQGMPIIQAFRRTNETQGEFEQLNTRHYVYQKKMIVLSALTSFNLVNALRGVAFVAFIWFFGSNALSGGSLITAGVLYAFVDYLTRLFEPMTQIVNQLPQLEQARVAGARVFELLDEKGEKIEQLEMNRIKGDVLFDNVSFAYEKDDYILKNVNFHVKPGETVAFVGHTGSGKSSIMNLLFRFYDPQKGSIKIDGMETSTLTRQQVRHHIGIVLQDPFIFTGTVLSNITLNDPAITREKAIAALKAVGADQFIERLPNQYDEPVGENGSEFSTGQRQLLSFARALAFDPAILILDEATANIDTETEGLIQEAMKVLAKGRTMLVIAHRLSTIQHADEIIVLERGQIIEKGTHQELLQQRGNYYQMYKMQQGTSNKIPAV